MLETTLLQILMLSLITNMVLSLISFALIIALTIITYKRNYISANH